MALFSLLIALLLERTLSLGEHWQFEFWFEKFSNKLSGIFEPTAGLFQLLVLSLPAAVVYLLLQWSQGLLFGLVSLVIWVVVVLLSIGCLHYRQLYKKYLLSVCHDDVQGSYHLAANLAELELLDIEDQAKLGSKVGRQLTWVNYRFYCATVLMMIIGGPVAVVFYASVRTVDLLIQRQHLPASSIVRGTLLVLDWLPARIVALGYVLVGNFSHAISLWFSLVIKPRLPAYQLISQVAMAAEQVSHTANTSGVCMESTCRLVHLAKRNLLLLVGIIALMTIVGVTI